MNDVLTLENLHHTFEKGTINENHVLKGINLSLDSSVVSNHKTEHFSKTSWFG